MNVILTTYQGAILGPIARVLGYILQALYALLANFGIENTGICMILFTFLVNGLMMPMQIKQQKFSKMSMIMNPEIQAIQKKYKNNPEKAQQEMMKLYKENNVNPMSGCLPLLIQMPILFALYYVFTGLAELKGVSFLWLGDLWAPDRTLILPILSAATTYLSSLLMTKFTQSQAGGAPGGMNMNTMNIVMAGMMGVMSIQFPSMLVLYWVIGNLIQMVQTYFIVVLPSKKRAKEKEQYKDIK